MTSFPSVCYLIPKRLSPSQTFITPVPNVCRRGAGRADVVRVSLSAPQLPQAECGAAASLPVAKDRPDCDGAPHQGADSRDDQQALGGLLFHFE